jgi:hypothetical protein
MTALEYMEKQVAKHRLNFNREWERGAPEEVLHNITEKIHHYEAAVEALRKELHETKSELVHCRDCKHRRRDKCPMYRVEIVQWMNDELMPEWDEIEHDSTKDDGYCDRGEREEKDG